MQPTITIHAPYFEPTDLQRQMLASTYIHGLDRKETNINAWAIAHGLQQNDVNNAFAGLEKIGFTKYVYQGGETGLTGYGVILCEKLGLGDSDRVSQDVAVRAQILDDTAKLRELHGVNAHIPVQLAMPAEPFDHMQWDYNLTVLCDSGLVVIDIDTIDLTAIGYRTLEDWRARSAIHSRLANVETLPPAERESELGLYISQLLTYELWNVVNNRERDVLAERYGLFYKFTCIWKAVALCDGDLQALSALTQAQPAVRQVVVSLHGFTEAANTYAAINSFVSPVLLLDEDDLDSLLSTADVTLDSILKQKMEAVIEYHVSHPTPHRPAPHHSLAAPEDLHPFLRAFASANPEPSKCVFLMMRFGNTPAHEAITSTIKDTLARHGLTGLRADDKAYAPDVLANIRTYLHGCGLGVAVFERLTSNDFNPNVSFELGYMYALRKEVCLLKDTNLSNLHTDVGGLIYRTFDPQNIEDTVTRQIEAWLRERGLTMAQH